MGVDKIGVKSGENRQKYKFSACSRALGEWTATVGDHVQLARGQSETHLQVSIEQNIYNFPARSE